MAKYLLHLPRFYLPTQFLIFPLLAIVEGSVKPYIEDDSEKLRPIVRFDFRGMEPVEFSPREGWRVVSTSDSATVFSDVDLTDGVSQCLMCLHLGFALHLVMDRLR